MEIATVRLILWPHLLGSEVRCKVRRFSFAHPLVGVKRLGASLGTLEVLVESKDLALLRSANFPSKPEVVSLSWEQGP